MKIALLLLLFSFSFSIFAEEPNSKAHTITIGHNVTPSTEITKANTWTVGNYAIGYGLTDSFLIATSPWIWATYNTANIHLKWIQQSGAWQYGAFASYFKSYNSTPLVSSNGGSGISNKPPKPPNGHSSPQPVTYTITTLDRYQWESINAHLLLGYTFSEYTKINANLHYGYFFDDEFPYSIRMDPGTDSIRNQIDLTTLTKLKWNDQWGVLLEFGGLGLNYYYPYMQSGFSLIYQGTNWYTQLGFSYTAQFRELTYTSAWTPGRYDSRLHYSTTAQQYYFYRYLQTALHPEVQIQYYF